MASTASFQLLTPTRPTLVDYGNNLKENKTKMTPNPTQPNAEEWNKMGLMLEALARTSPSAILTYTRSGTVYTLATVQCWNTALTATSFVSALNRTGAGVFTFTVPASTLPPMVSAPLIIMNEPALTTAGSYDAVLTSPTQISIKLFRNNAAADSAFTMHVYLNPR